MSIEETSEQIKRLLEAFQDELSKKQKLKEATVNGHLGRLSFFAYHYLEYVGEPLEEFSSDQITDFLGDYYIRKVLTSKEKDVGPYLTSFKKFAKFLFDQGTIEKAEYDEILFVCKQKDYFTYRFDTYYQANDLEEWYFENDLYDYLEATKAIFEEDLNEGFKVSREFVALLDQQDFEPPIAVKAFAAFIEKIMQLKKVELTNNRRHITRKFWRELDEDLQLNLFTEPRLNQEDIALFHFGMIDFRHC